MIYNFENIYDKSLLTKEFVENKLTHEQLYERYLNITGIKLKQFVRSPFSRDSNPSFKFIVKDNTLLWKCFSTNKSGDIYTLISELYNINDFKEVLEKIATDWSLIPFIEKKDFTRVTPVQKQYEESKPAEISVVLRDYNQEDLEYWMQYEIAKEDLIRFDIKPVQESWLNTRLWRKHQLGNPCYRYLVKGKYKLYWPKEPDKTKKFICNTTQDTVFGADKLDFTKEHCIITSSYKDVVALYKLNYTNCICGNSETTIFSESIINKLQSKFARITVLMNNDSAGIKAMEKYDELYGLDYFVIPELFDGKDVSDQIMNNGLEFTKDLFHYHLKP